MPTTQNSMKPRNARRKNRNGRYPFRIGTILLLIVAPFLIAGAIGVTATQFEDHDTFCASCHTQPETEYYQRESAAQPTDLASFHKTKDTRCIDCHASKGVVGRAGALMLGARDLWAFVSHNYKQPAPLTRTIGDMNCLKCHANITQRQDFNNHFHIFLSKWQALDAQAAGCVDCHQSHTMDGDPTLAFLNQGTTQQVCQKCHNFAGRGG